MTQRQRELAYALAGAALLIALPLLGAADVLDAGLGQRLSGVAIGLILAAYGNIAPKQLVRYDPESPRPARKQAFIRFSGRVFVIAGLAHALVWALAPIDRATLLSMIPVAAGLILVGLRCASSRSASGNA
ncbi:MAG: SdpI family protein [Sphingomonas sp.]|nr:SdpI family protein [Sphingomonas sp.]